jgi:hypothetical protein
MSRENVEVHGERGEPPRADLDNFAAINGALALSEERQHPRGLVGALVIAGSAQHRDHARERRGSPVLWPKTSAPSRGL